MAKRTFDPSITSSMQSAASDSFADNITMIEYGKLTPHDENFYNISDIELLAEDIERQGLKCNLVVREDANNKEKYIIISGHRRHKAIGLLIEKGRIKSKNVPCFINPQKTDDEELQDLIMLNATTRVLTDAEMFQQFKKLKKIFEAKKANGEKFGRIREKIAEVLGISNGQVAKLENIAKNAVPEVVKAVEDGEMSAHTADKMAGLSEDNQTEFINNTPIGDIKARDIDKRREISKMEKNAPLVTLNDESEPTPVVTPKKPKEKLPLVTQNDTTEFQQSCIGYVIEACREMGYDKEVIKSFISTLEEKFFEFTAENAALIYQNSV